MDINIIKMQLCILKKATLELSLQGVNICHIQAQINGLEESLKLLEKSEKDLQQSCTDGESGNKL